METQLILPSPPLTAYIKHIMVFSCNFSSEIPLIQLPVAPIPENFICFYGSNPVKYSNGSGEPIEKLFSLVGPHAKMMNITLPRKTFLLKVTFREGVLARLLHMPLTKLFEVKDYDTSGVFNEEIKAINEQIGAVNTVVEAVRIAEQFIEKLVKNIMPKDKIDFGLAELVKHKGSLSIEQAAAYCCLGVRQFERLCVNRTGYSPKYFSRLVRFAHAWIYKSRHPDKKWVDVAYEASYFDQMHFLRDFKEFMGLNPNKTQQLFNHPIEQLDYLAFEQK
jgi:AraC-like DNA-binding protein